ncbi:glycosyl hydrolases family 28-domain-containing protein [Tricladium varicosporioides]|nr:glycosyl hydrolases family 28-domain-containing protein [Hymenoscyphus varicosporioides]
MRSLFFISALAPLILACDNAKNDACAYAFTASSADAATFCATYTQGSSTATTNLPAFATACSNKPKKVSSACSCLTGGSTAPTTGSSNNTAIATSSPTPFSNATATNVDVAKVSSIKIVATTLVKAKSTSTSKATTKATKSTSVSQKGSSTKAVKSTSAAAQASSAVASVKATSAAASVGGANACTASEYAQITSVVASCTNIVLENISAPASSTIDLTGLQQGSTVTFAGTTSFGTTENSDFNPIEIAGTDITITGASGHVIDGNGQAYWDGQGSNGGTDKPDHFIVLDKMVNGKITNLNIQNWPVHCFDITGCDGMTISGLTLDNSAGDAANSASDGDPAAHNSDGFDISSTDNLVLSNTVVKNQDDCVAVTSGTNITVTGMTCSGGHGLSIGSVGGKSNNVVSGVTFSDSTISDSENGCRIKSNSGTTGTIENIVYKNITLSGITDYGIDVQQDYLNGGATGTPTNGVTISGVTFESITGTTTGDAIDYYVLCGTACSDFTFTDVSITGGSGTSSCNFPSTGCPS